MTFFMYSLLLRVPLLDPIQRLVSFYYKQVFLLLEVLKCDKRVQQLSSHLQEEVAVQTVGLRRKRLQQSLREKSRNN